MEHRSNKLDNGAKTALKHELAHIEIESLKV